MKPDSFIANRTSFAEDIGQPNLYDMIDHYALYAGVHTIANKLWTFELLKSTQGVPGDIIEFGCWKGANLMFLAKMSSLLEPYAPKTIIGFDNFSGLPTGVKEDGEFANTQTGKYCGDEQTLKKAISLFELENKVKLIPGDALATIPKYEKENPHSLISFAYLDFDLYEPTRAALKLLSDSISIGGVIVFDEACTTEWPGETLAMKEFLKETNKKFEMLSNPLSKQPTVAIRRVA
jgi:hypothetical protein